MTVRRITSEPKPSAKHEGWLYAYFNQRTANGGECAVIFTPALKDLIKPGLLFDDSCIHWSDEHRASVLELDFEEQPEEPGFPPAEGWGDPDPVPVSANGHAMAAVLERAGTRPAATRKREAQQQAVAGAQLPAALLKISLEVNRCFQMHYALLNPTVGEARRADVAQKLAATSCIPYFRQVGVALTEEDVKQLFSL
jgi:hypothetical protein